MYIVVEHKIHKPDTFWPQDPQQLTEAIPPHLKLIHTFAGTEGRRAVCVWEADSVDTLRAFLDPFVGESGENSYFPSVNRDGIAVPSKKRAAQPA